jgi:hypothetical protein
LRTRPHATVRQQSPGQGPNFRGYAVRSMPY